MAKEIRCYTKKNVIVLPFGVDMGQFIGRNTESIFKKDDIVIGTIKKLEEIYGIEYLIKAFNILVWKFEYLPLMLLIVGDGSLRCDLQKMVNDLQISNKVVFTGTIPFFEVSKYHNMLSIAVFLSNSESFGVSVIEASACGKPVVVSNIGGLTEVVEDKITGFIVPPRNPEAAANAIERLIFNKELRDNMGKEGRKRVKTLYNFNENVKTMLVIYHEVITRY
jgi:glycosyltransferase involved in cell wall biosynthesis